MTPAPNEPAPNDPAPNEPAPNAPEPTDPEDAKIITLARSALVRSGGSEGAAVRDTDGRTYAASSVDLPHLTLSALAVAVAMAVSSGAEGLEALALASPHGPSTADLDLARDLPGTGVVVWSVDPRGAVLARIEL